MGEILKHVRMLINLKTFKASFSTAHWSAFCDIYHGNLCQPLSSVWPDCVPQQYLYSEFYTYRYFIILYLQKKQIHYIRAEKTVVLYDARTVPGPWFSVHVLFGGCALIDATPVNHLNWKQARRLDWRWLGGHMMPPERRFRSCFFEWDCNLILFQHTFSQFFGRVLSVEGWMDPHLMFFFGN